MAKVYVAIFHREECRLKKGWLARLTGLNNWEESECILGVYDTEDKVKDHIRNWIAMDHTLNDIRRDRGLSTHNYELDDRSLREYGWNRSYRYDEDGVRTMGWYEYLSYEVM